MAGLSKVDKTLITLVGRVPLGEIADRTGIPVAKIMTQFDEVIGRPDVLSIAQRRTALLMQIEHTTEEFRERLAHMEDKHVGPAFNAWRSAMDMMLKELRYQEKIGKEDEDAAQAKYAMLFVEIASRAMQAVVERFADVIPVDEVEAAYHEALGEIASEYDDR